MQVERLAGRLERRDHLIARRPAFDALVGAQLEPVGAALDQLHFTAALHHMKDRIAAPRTGVQLDERIGDQDLVRFVLLVFSGLGTPAANSNSKQRSVSGVSDRDINSPEP